MTNALPVRRLGLPAAPGAARSPLRRSPYRSSPTTPSRLLRPFPPARPHPARTPPARPGPAADICAAIPAAAPSRCPREAHAAPRQATPSLRHRPPSRRRPRHRNPGCSDRPGDLTALRGTTNLLRSIASTPPSSWSCPATAMLGHYAWPSRVLPGRASPAGRLQSPVPGQPRRPPEAGPARPHRIRHDGHHRIIVNITRGVSAKPPDAPFTRGTFGVRNE